MSVTVTLATISRLSLVIKTLGYKPADLTVHPPPPKKTIEGGFIFLVSVSSVPQKNVLRGKPVLF